MHCECPTGRNPAIATDFLLLAAGDVLVFLTNQPFGTALTSGLTLPDYLCLITFHEATYPQWLPCAVLRSIFFLFFLSTWRGDLVGFGKFSYTLRYLLSKHSHTFWPMRNLHFFPFFIWLVVPYTLFFFFLTLYLPDIIALSLDDPEEGHRLKHVGLTIELFCILEGLPLKPASPLKALSVFFQSKGNYQLLYIPDWKKEFPSTCSLNSFNGQLTKKLWTDGPRWCTSISVYAFIIIIIRKLFLPLFFLFASLV